jgi:hypothetical protein
MKTLEELRYEFGGLSGGGELEDYVYQYMEGYMHDYGKNLHGKIMDLENELRQIPLLESKIEELQEGLTEVRNDYQDICDLAGQLAPRAERAYLLGEVSRENWERFKNHIGW